MLGDALLLELKVGIRLRRTLIPRLRLQRRSTVYLVVFSKHERTQAFCSAAQIRHWNRWNTCNVCFSKKLICRRETARCFMSLNISLSHSSSLKMVPFESLGRTASYSHIIATMALSLAVSKIFSVKEWRDLEIRIWGGSRSLKMAPFDRPYTTFYCSVVYLFCHFQDKARCWSKMLFFLTLPVFDAPCQGVSVGILRSRLVRKN